MAFLTGDTLEHEFDPFLLMNPHSLGKEAFNVTRLGLEVIGVGNHITIFRHIPFQKRVNCDLLLHFLPQPLIFASREIQMMIQDFDLQDSLYAQHIVLHRIFRLKALFFDGTKFRIEFKG